MNQADLDWQVHKLGRDRFIEKAELLTQDSRLGGATLSVTDGNRVVEAHVFAEPSETRFFRRVIKTLLKINARFERESLLAESEPVDFEAVAAEQRRIVTGYGK